MDGNRYEVDAQDLGDWYDLDAVLGMPNALCRARGKAWSLHRASHRTDAGLESGKAVEAGEFDLD